MARQLDRRVDEALRAVATDVACRDAGRWLFSMVNGEAIPVQASFSEGWLELSTPLPPWSPLRDDHLLALRLSAQLPGSSRIGRLFGEAEIRVHADASVEHVADLARWTRDVCSGFSAIVHMTALTDTTPLLSAADPAAASITAAELERACRMSGWPVARTGDAGVRAGIVTQTGEYSACYAREACIPPAFVVELCDLKGQSAVCRRAMAALLLAVSGSVRWVKGAFVYGGDGTTAALLSPLACPLEQSADEALSALSVACQLVAREVRALADERLAADYLALTDTVDQPSARTSMEEQTCLQ